MELSDNETLIVIILLFFALFILLALALFGGEKLFDGEKENPISNQLTECLDYVKTLTSREPANIKDLIIIKLLHSPNDILPYPKG